MGGKLVMDQHFIQGGVKAPHVNYLMVAYIYILLLFVIYVMVSPISNTMFMTQIKFIIIIIIIVILIIFIIIITYTVQYSLIITSIYDTMQNNHYIGGEGQGEKAGGQGTLEVGGERVGSRVLRRLEAEKKCKMVILPSQTRTQNVFALNLI